MLTGCRWSCCRRTQRPKGLDYLLEDAQRNMSMDGTPGLGTEEIVKENGLFPPCRLRVVAGRAKKFLRVAYDAEFVPLLCTSRKRTKQTMEGLMPW